MKTNVIRGNFSMGDIDQVSSLLGGIKSDIANLANGHQSINEKLVIINDKISDHATNRILDRSAIDSLHRRMDVIEPIVDSHGDKFKFIAWVVAGITSIITLLINWFAPFIGRILS